MMPCVAVVALNRMSSMFSDDMALRWQDFSESIPIIRIECAVFQMLQFVVEPFECCAITTTKNPGDNSPAATVNGLDEPKLSFFESVHLKIHNI